jgi:serpin B
MMKTIWYGLILVAVVAVGIGCAQPQAPTAAPNGDDIPAQGESHAADPTPRTPEPQSTAGEITTLVAAHTAFGLDLYKRLALQDGNLFCSPTSIATVLAMTQGGARGRTADQMAEVLRVGPLGDRLHGAVGAHLRELTKEGPERDYELHIANALWGQRGYGFLGPFVALGEIHYGAPLRELDFKGDTEAARQMINAWIAKRTRDKIPELLQPGVLSAMTRLVLTNAIYFKGPWATAFDPQLTRPGIFRTASGAEVETSMMSLEDRFPYAEAPELQILELPYRGDELSMVILLPHRPDGLTALEDSLSPELLAQWTGRLVERKVKVLLPKFTITSRLDLKPVLQEMGISDAFDPQGADFSGMNNRRDLFISAVVHQAFVEVTEEGTEAAGATGVAIGVTSLRPRTPVFRADRPFIVIIRHCRSGSILFIGRLTNPQG